MSFFLKNNKKRPSHGTKIPPKSAFGHYNKKQGVRASLSRPEKGERQLQMSVSDLSLSYDKNTVVSSLSFEFHEGDYIAIIGENGSGKSTLMNALLGLLEPSGGEIKSHIKKSEIGVLNQTALEESDFPATVGEVVLSGCLGRDGNRLLLGKAAKQKAFSAMEKLGITSLADRSFRELSGGQRQRTLIARALCSAKSVLFLDEPTTALDRAVISDLYALIDDLNRGGMTIVTVTHDLRAALDKSSHILHVSPDSCLYLPTEEYKKTPAAQALLTASNQNDDTLPYGEGGFRYTGGKS